MEMMKFIEQLKDPYERKARVTPGLLVALPLLVPLVAIYGQKHFVLTGVLAVLGGCGAIFALANIARGRGKALEERLVDSWGAFLLPSFSVIETISSIAIPKNAITRRLGRSWEFLSPMLLKKLRHQKMRTKHT